MIIDNEKGIPHFKIILCDIISKFYNKIEFYNDTCT